MYAVIRRQPAVCGGEGIGGERAREREGSEPSTADPGRAGLTAPHLTGPLYSQLHLPAMIRTLKRGGNFRVGPGPGEERLSQRE